MEVAAKRMLAALRAAAIASPATRGRSSGAMTTQANGRVATMTTAAAGRMRRARRA